MIQPFLVLGSVQTTNLMDIKVQRFYRQLTSIPFQTQLKLSSNSAQTQRAERSALIKWLIRASDDIGTPSISQASVWSTGGMSIIVARPT